MTVQVVLEQLFEGRRLAAGAAGGGRGVGEPGGRGRAGHPNRRRRVQQGDRERLRHLGRRALRHRPRDPDSDDGAVVVGTLRGHLHDSGMEVSAAHGQVWTLREGRVTRMEWFNTHRAALEAAGVAE